MKKNKLVLMMCLFFSVFSISEAQKIAWPFFQNGDYQTANFKNGLGWGNSIPRLKKPNSSDYITEYIGLNQEYDVNGKVIFTVISTVDGVYLYDKDNNYVAPQTYDVIAYCPEITIVPYQSGIVYHILVGGIIWEYNLATKLLENVAGDYGTYNMQSNGTPYKSSMQAVRSYNEISECDTQPGYVIYSLNANEPGKTGRYICVNDVKNTGQFSPEFNNIQFYNITIENGASTNFSYNHCEMELSPDGSKLAIVDRKNIFVYSVNTSNKKITGLYKYFLFDPGDSTNYIGGLEFNDNNNLYFSLFKIYDVNYYRRGLYHWDLSSTANPVRFSNSSDFSNSMIEKGKDGFLYTVKSNGIYKINTNNNTTSLALSSANSLIPRLDIYKQVYGISGSNINSAVYFLPDQLDNQINENIDLGNVVSKYVFKAKKKYNLNNSFHGITPNGYGKIIVLDSIIVESNCTVTLNEMNFEFWNDAIFNIYPNSIVVLKGTSLTGKECGLMWQGVRLLSSKQNMLSNSLIMVKSTSGLPSRIADAYIAIKSIHSLSIVQATQESIFERNEKHMFLQNATLSRTKIESCKFFGDLVLKDQYKGSNNGYSDFKNRTKIGIELINANVKIGGSGILGNLIKGGQLGISAVGSDVIIYNDELTGQMDYGVLYNGNNLYSKSLEVHCSKFHDLYRGMKILNKTKSSTIMKNKFLNTSGYGIEYISNQGGELKIGDSLQNNEFNNCNWAAIQCFDNGRFSNLTNNIIPNSQIFIKFNKIDNHVYASGIAISEPTAAGQNFGKVIVYKNQMGSQQPIGQGIVLKQIFGSNPTNPIVPISTNSIPYSSSFLISNNYVQFTNVLNPTYRGMWSENSPGQNFLMNDISCVGSGDWRPSSLRINDGPKNLVYQNSLHAGFGLQVTGIGLFSNYYCNSLNNCVTGIQLEWNYLRNAASGPNAAHDEYKIHANKIININGRPNSFNNTISWGSDINVYNQAIDRNQWDFVSNNLPKISYLKKSALFPNGIVHQTKRQNPCDAGSIPMDSSILDTVFVEYQNDTNFVFKWKLMHSIARDYISGNTNQKVNNAGICKLVNIEKSIQNGKFEIADSLLNIYIPCNYIESDFKKVYKIWVSKNSISNLNQLPSSFYRLDTIWKDSLDFALDSLMSDSSCKIINQIELADSLINQLSKIASQNATLFNPASYPARAILYGTKHLLFSDSLVEFLPNITGNIESACTGYQNCEIQIFEDSGNFTGINTYTDSNGYFLFGGNQLKSLDSTKFYYLKSVLADSTIITSNSDYWKSLAYNGSWVFSCLKPIQLKNTTLNNLPKFYPNPGNSFLTFDNLPENWYISIYNLAGQQIYAAKGSEIKFEFKHNLTQGIYSIQIKDTKNGKVTNEKYMVD